MYIGGFTAEENPIFRDPNSTFHNCNLCKNFIRRYGNIVSLDENYNIITMFDAAMFITGDYAGVAKAMSKALKATPIKEVFFETFNELNELPYEVCKKSNTLFKLGIDKNTKRYTAEEAAVFGVVKANETKTFNHLHLFTSNKFVDASGDSVETIMGKYRDAKNVFQRAMQEIPLDTLTLVKDLINQGSLLNGTTHLYKIEEFLPLKKEYDAIPVKKTR